MREVKLRPSMSLCPLSNSLYINNTPSKCSKPVGICGVSCGSAAASEETSTASLQREFSEMQLSWSASGWGFGQAKIEYWNSKVFSSRQDKQVIPRDCRHCSHLQHWDVFTVNIWFHSKNISFGDKRHLFHSRVGQPLPCLSPPVPMPHAMFRLFRIVSADSWAPCIWNEDEEFWLASRKPV